MLSIVIPPFLFISNPIFRKGRKGYRAKTTGEQYEEADEAQGKAAGEKDGGATGFAGTITDTSGKVKWSVTSSEGVTKEFTSDTTVTLDEGGSVTVILAILDLYDPAAFATVTAE